MNVGKLNEIKEYELAMGNFSIPGKMFAGHALRATGAELSFQSLAAGQDYGTRHAHKTHEELYFILKGEGVFDVDGKRFPVSEGSIVRIAPMANVPSRTQAAAKCSCFAYNIRQIRSLMMMNL